MANRMVKRPSKLFYTEYGDTAFQVADGVPGMTVWIAWETKDTDDGTFFTREQWEELRSEIDARFDPDRI